MTADDTTTPAWETAPAPPPWVLEVNATATNWRNAGARRWRADLPGPFAPHLLVVVNAGGYHSVRFALDLDYLGGLADAEVVEDTFNGMQERLDYEALPECVAPGCTDKGECRFVVAELGHLAGRVYAAGDEIRMCWAHGNDVRTAGEGLDQIAEWLRPDARVMDLPYNIAGRYDGHPADMIHRTRARLPRVLRPAGDTP